VAVYDRFEAQFEIQSSAANPYLPYDPNPPAGLSPGEGILVDALFSPDQWNTIYTQPAFWYQRLVSRTLTGYSPGYTNPCPASGLRISTCAHTTIAI